MMAYDHINTVSSRYLLLDPVPQNYADGCIMVVASGTYLENHILHLTLIAPGIKDLDDVSYELAEWIGDPLAKLDRHWIYDVSVQSNPQGESSSYIEVVIEDPARAPGVPVDEAVLDMARMFFGPTSRNQGKRVFTLRSGERLVPIIFESDESGASTYMSFTLSSKLTFVAPRLISMVPDRELRMPDGSIDNDAPAHNLLEQALAVHVQRLEWVRNVELRNTTRGTTVDFMFDSSYGLPGPERLNQFEQLICQVLASLVKIEDGQLQTPVFVPAYPHVASSGEY